MGLLENRRAKAYSLTMNKVDNHQTAPAGWVESLDRSKAQIEAGQTVPVEPALQRLRDSLARMDAKRSKQASDR